MFVWGFFFISFLWGGFFFSSYSLFYLPYFNKSAENVVYFGVSSVEEDTINLKKASRAAK